MTAELTRDLNAILDRFRPVPGVGGEFDGAIINGQDSVGRVSQLQHQLYQNRFCSPRNDPSLVAEFSPAVPDGLLNELSAANAGRDHWVTGWEVTGSSASGQIQARRHEWKKSFWPGEFLIPDAPGVAPRIGMKLNAYFPKESTAMQAGFYFAFGNSEEEVFEERAIVRFYWAIQAQGAADLVRRITARFNRFQVPFRMKLPAHGGYYNRLDAAVLYVNKRFYQISRMLADEIHAAVHSALWPGSPLFTKRLRPGLGLAEDPGTGESFGMNRCRILAEGMWKAHDARCGSADACLSEIQSHFRSYGLSLDHPYLGAGSVDQYDFDWGVIE